MIFFSTSFLKKFYPRSSVAATFIATLVIMMEESVSGGCADSEQTRAMITSLWFISEGVAGESFHKFYMNWEVLAL